MRRAAIALVVLVAACSSGSGSKASSTSSEPSSSSASSSAAPTSSTTTTTRPTTTTLPQAGEEIVLEHARVTVTIRKFRITDAGTASDCARELRIAQASGGRCLAVDFTITAAADLADEGSVVFDSYVPPSGAQADSAFIYTVAPGGVKTYTAMFASGETGGTLRGDLGISNVDTEDFTVTVPTF